MPGDEEILHSIREHLSTIPSNTHIEIGFFGGTFTGLPLAEQERLLRLVSPFMERGEVNSLRCSTHPLYINGEILRLLKRYGMNTVELGVQSMDDEVLRQVGRGYTSGQVREAAAQIRAAGLNLGMQMMVGLPGDSPEKSYQTAQNIVDCGAENTRIYPTLVVQQTVLADLYRQGKYTPLTLDKAVTWVKKPLRFFQEKGVTVLRVGLHPTQGFINGQDYLAGPFHVSFKELVQTAIWKEVFEDFLAARSILIPCDKAASLPRKDFFTREESNLHPETDGREKGNQVVFAVNPQQLNSAIGYHSSNKQWLCRYFNKVTFLPDVTLSNYEYKVINLER